MSCATTLAPTDRKNPVKISPTWLTSPLLPEWERGSIISITKIDSIRNAAEKITLAYLCGSWYTVDTKSCKDPLDLRTKSGPPERCLLSDGPFVLAALAAPVKPLAYVVCHYTCSDRQEKPCKDLAHLAHLPSATRVGKRQHHQYNKNRQYPQRR